MTTGWKHAYRNLDALRKWPLGGARAKWQCDLAARDRSTIGKSLKTETGEEPFPMWLATSGNAVRWIAGLKVYQVTKKAVWVNSIRQCLDGDHVAGETASTALSSSALVYPLHGPNAGVTWLDRAMFAVAQHGHPTGAIDTVFS